MSIPALTATSPSVLGKMLVESAILFEAGAAVLVAAEGEKLRFLIRVASSPSRRFTPTQLVTANQGIRDTICCLGGLENAILNKIAAGTSLIRRGF